MAPVDNSPSERSSFELVCSLKANDTIPVYKYKSVNTGITVVIAEIEGPIIDGNFCIVTEAHDDDGLPHTLEHLIFLGSEDYPYKGVLDLWANRCYASGTNAYTDVDHTSYTMETAGSEGFLSLMSLYLDHILYPTLQDAAFLTEVHHITGTGEDAGVVYCEMQGTENVGENLTYVQLIRAVYPGDCGYKSITGGVLKNLRESTSNEKVRNYHKAFYRPENLGILILGQVKHANVFKTLQPLEDKIMSKGPRGTFEKPWRTPVEPIKENKDIDVYYPCDDEDNGMVSVGWQGPGIKEVYETIGCNMLMKYLTATAISPLMKTFVEIEDPYANNVGAYIDEKLISFILLVFSSVPLPKIPLVKDLLVKTLNEVYNNKDIDMLRMKRLLHKETLEILMDYENNPHDLIAPILTTDMMYGETKEDFEDRLNNMKFIKKLGGEPQSFWLGLLKKYLIDGPMVLVKGIPSIKKKEELTAQEKERIAKQIESLGKEGLENKAKELERAKMENEKPIPDDLFGSIPLPSIDNIKFHHSKCYRTEDSEQHPKFDLTKLPLYTFMDHLNSNFVNMSITMDTSCIEAKYRQYIPLLFEVILESPVNRNGNVIPYEQVVAELEADTVALAPWFGFANADKFSCNFFGHLVAIYFQVELAKYEKCVQWIKELLFDSILTLERLKIIATKIINEVPDHKRDGDRIANDLMKELYYKRDCNRHVFGMLRQYKFLTKLVERFDDETELKDIIADMEYVRKMLTKRENMMLHISANVDKLAGHVPDLYAPWRQLATVLGDGEKEKLKRIPDWCVIDSPVNIPIQGCVTGMGCIDSSYMRQTCPCINDYLHPDVPALFVCIQYLSQLEGPMWRSIRGQGLSYSYSINLSINEGLLNLKFYKATNVVGAYKAAMAIVESHLAENNWQKFLFESAKASLIFSYISNEKNVGNITLRSVDSYLKQVPFDYNRKILHRISGVTIDDMKRVAVQYLKPLFDPAQCKTTIVCHPLKTSEIAAAFKEMNHDLKIYETVEETYLNDL